MAMPDTNAFKVLRAQKPHTDEELELIQGTVFQRAVPEFAPLCNDRQTCLTGFKQQCALSNVLSTAISICYSYSVEFIKQKVTFIFSCKVFLNVLYF